MMICNICKNTTFRNLFRIQDLKHRTTKDKFLLRRCLRCSIIIVTKNGYQVDGSMYYPQQYSAYKKIKQIQDNYKILPFNIVKGRMGWTKMFKLQEKHKILDIGCGNGRHMAYLKRKYNVDVVGIELNQKAVAVGKNAGLNIFHGSIDDYATNNEYDVIYLSHVLEHLSKPYDALKNINKLLKKGGRIVIALPNTKSFERYLFKQYWWGWDTPRHIYMFSPKSIKYLLQETGFNNIEIYYEVYSNFKNSTLHLLNKRKYNNIFLNKILNKINSLLSKILPLFRFSGAIQITARNR
jgi:2-polyprenyl-3-methyl-5-hydroxy-6-metoxy-1,4-benzoquinol methylase